MNKRKLIIGIFFIAASFQTDAQKNLKLIEFGWDYPDVSQLYSRLDSMQNTPFDGICFSLQRNIMEVFDTTLRGNNYFQLDKLAALKWGKYHNNFIILRGFSKTGGSWFDDRAWNNICANATNLSAAMASGYIAGILFDPEYYYEDKRFNPWTYSTEQYPDKTISDVQDQVRKRGKQFISYLQSKKDSFTFISIWMASLIAREKKYTPLEKTRHILLISFIDGILKGKNPNVKIVDGNEYAYWNQHASEFFESKDLLKNTMLNLLTSEKAKSEVDAIQVAQPVFYDGLLATSSAFDKGLRRNTRWKWLNENIKWAMASTDKYVWFYDQRVNWWKGDITDTLFNVLTINKSLFLGTPATLTTANFKKSYFNKISNNDFNSNLGYLDDIDSTPSRAAFVFQWTATEHELKIKFYDKNPVKSSVYINDSLASQVTQPKSILTEYFPSFKRGTMVIINKYADKTESSSIYILR